jgi:hypothetical protein
MVSKCFSSQVPWHPSLALERMQQACSEAALGERSEAIRLMELCVPALVITHGGSHPYVERANVVREAFRRAPQLAAAARMMRPYTTAVSRVRS